MNLRVFQIPWFFVVFHHVDLFLCHTLNANFPMSDGFTSPSPHSDPNVAKVILLPWSCCDGEFRPIERKVFPFATKPPTNPRENEISVLLTEEPLPSSSTGISVLETQTETCCSSQSPIETTSQTKFQNILTSEVSSATMVSTTTTEGTRSENIHTSSFEPSMISSSNGGQIAITTSSMNQTPNPEEETTFVDHTAESTTNFGGSSNEFSESSPKISSSPCTNEFAAEETPSMKIVEPHTVLGETLKITSIKGGSNLITMPLTESSRQGVSVTDIEQEGPSETYPTSSYSTDEPGLTSDDGYTEDSGPESSPTDNTITQPDPGFSPTDYSTTDPNQGLATDYPITEPGQGSSPTDYPGSTQVDSSSGNPTDYPMTPDASQPDYSTPQATDYPSDSGASTDLGSEPTRPTEMTRQPPGISTPTSGSNFPCVKFSTIQDWQNDLSSRALKLRSTLIRVRFIGIHTSQQAQSIMRGVYWLNGLSRSLRRSRFSWTRNLYGHSKLLGLLRCESSFNNFGQRVSGMLWQRRFCCFGGFKFNCGTI